MCPRTNRSKVQPPHLIFTCPRYNVEEAQEEPAFSISASLEDRNSLNVCAKVCNSYGENLHTFFQYIGSKEETKMVMMEVEMVTGGNF